MANPVNPQVEQRLLICALETRNPRIKGKILATTAVDDYATDEGMLCRKRMDTLLSMGKSLGSADAFGEDPALTKAAKAWITGTHHMRTLAAAFTRDEVDSYIRTLKMHKNVRQVYAAQQEINEIAGGALDENGVAGIEGIMEATLMGIREGFERQPILHIGNRQTKEEAQALLNKALTFDAKHFVSTGQLGLDKHLHGWEKGNLVTISAPRSGGKSTMALTMAINQYLEANLNVCFVSMEMTEDELVKRALSNISQVPHTKIRYSRSLEKEEDEKIRTKFRQFFDHGHNSNCSFSIWDVKDAFFTPMRMESLIAPYMYDVIYVDYITLFHADTMDTWKMQLEYSRYLKSMAKRLNCVIVVLTQLSDEERVKYGKGIEENTDYWMWWRYREDEEEESGKGVLRLDKARHAPKRRFGMDFLFDRMNITTSLNAPANQETGKDKKKKQNNGIPEAMTNSTPGWPPAQAA